MKNRRVRMSLELFHRLPFKMAWKPEYLNGKSVARVRSVSMNGFLEGGANKSPSAGSVWFPQFFRYDRMSDIRAPAPSLMWVVAED